jgi:hypothetical protein
MSELQGIARFRFHPGKVEEFKRLSAEAMEISAPAGNPAVRDLLQRRRVRGDGPRALPRLPGAHRPRPEYGPPDEPIIATATVTGELLGELSPELRALMKGDVPRLFSRALRKTAQVCGSVA